MTSKQFIKTISEEHKIPQTTIMKILDATEIELKKLFMNEGEVKTKVLDFSFENQVFGTRKSRNPRTGEEITLPERRRLKVTQSADWKRITEKDS